ncbi:type VI-B CRISPR-associated RNA-guided ribonuclease Cas13b [Flavobacterium beibuense]|uniref:Uncharacterized protein n=1 Tax=Flavobacterium beibuense TaxID=657326 RepID=A0A444W715_9FLAO|nr:type VI-B CRISPR-associated RNA-guided ribonuclease Cas13b [Flavobacterium beibuense]RYJ41573.1 hypothetical protein NU09_2947 [Flavobacterium beibuense]
MEETTTMGKGVAYDHTLFKDKHYFAGYLNLAVNNIENVFKTVYKNRFDIKQHNLYKILDSLDGQISEPDYIERVSFLKQYFPVLHYLDLHPDNKRFTKEEDKVKARRRYLINNLRLLIETLSKLRDFYTHYYHKPLSIEQNTFSLIDNIFLNVVIDVKRQKKKNDHTRQLLKDSLKEEMDILYQKTKASLKEKQKENTRIKLDSETINNTIFNNSFSHLIYRRKKADNDILSASCKSEYKGEPTENGINVSVDGLLFFLGIFLSRKESNDLRGRIKGFKGTVIKDLPDFPNEKNNSLKFMATHWVFTYLNIKPIKQKLNTNFSRETLLLQIVDELTKIPNEIYRNLCFKKQQEFVEDINEYIKEGDDIDTLNSSTVIHPVIRKRYENKFNYFVLRYLDEFVSFNSLRFQIYLGNYVHHIQRKKLSGTEYETERVIKEKINVFGKLSEVSNIKGDYFIQNNPDNEALGWEIYPNPSYNFTGNNIPIYFDINDQDKEKINEYKSIRNFSEKRILRKKNKKNKQEIFDLINNTLTTRVFTAEPTAILSLNELPALLYTILCENKTASEIENLLRRTYLKRLNTIKNYQPGTLPQSKITKNLNKSTNQESLDVSKLIKAMKHEISISNEKLTLIKKNQNEVKDTSHRRKYVFNSKELGIEATWLANDLKRFMPKKVRENWKGYMHSQLQNSIAYYSQKPKEALSILSSVWNFNDDNYIWNEGIKKAFNEKEFEKFYCKYLASRNKTLEKLKENLDNLEYKTDKRKLDKFIKQQNLDCLFHIRTYTIDSTQEQINKLLAKPLVFPRGIFDSKPTFVKNESVTEKPELFADWYTYTYKEHPLQEFYSFTKDYECNFKKEKLTVKEFVKNQEQLNPEEQLNLFKLKEDLSIKCIKNQDLFLKLVVDNIYNKIFEYNIDISLKNLYISRKERIAIGLKAKELNQINDSYIWGKTILYQDKQIRETKVQLKDINKIKRFLEEDKVKQILSYDINKQWEIEELKYELYIKPNSYEVIRREKLFKAIQEFESYILTINNFDGSNHPSILEYNSNPRFKHYVVNGLLLKKGLATNEEIEWLLAKGQKEFNTFDKSIVEKPEIIQKAFLLVLIRNKFAHSQLPIKEYYEMIRSYTKNIENLNTTEIIFQFTTNTINELKR